MISWGLLSSAMMLVRGPASFYGLRFLLGAAEAGFFPGIIYYLSEWFPSETRARVIARFMTAIPLAGVIAGPLSGALLGLGGRLGLAGWQWLFLVEGIPSLILGFATLAFLTERPEDAHWLTPEERSWLAGRLHGERQGCLARHDLGVLRALSNGTVWQLGLLEGLSLAGGTYAISFWLPQMVKAFSGLSDLLVGVVTAVPYLAAAAAMVLVAAHSDRTGERCLPIAFCSAAPAVGFIVSAYARTPVLAVTALSLAAAGTLSVAGPFWTLPASFLSGEAYAAALALINSVANVMGFATPYALGLLKDATGGYSAGLGLLALLPMAGAALALHLRRAPALMTLLQPATAPVGT